MKPLPTFIAPGLCLLVGVFLGLAADRIPFVTLDREVALADLGNALLVLGLALVVPFWVTSRLDNKRCEKNLLIEELGLLNETIGQIDELLMNMCGEILPAEKFREMMFLMKKARMQMAYISDQVGDSSTEVRFLRTQSLADRIQNYWDLVTGEEGIKPSGFRVESEFLMKQTLAFDSALREARKLKFLVNDA